MANHKGSYEGGIIGEGKTTWFLTVSISPSRCPAVLGPCVCGEPNPFGVIVKKVKPTLEKPYHSGKEWHYSMDVTVKADSEHEAVGYAWKYFSEFDPERSIWEIYVSP